MTFEDRIVEALRAPIAPEARSALDLRVRVAIDGTPRRRRRRTWVTRGLVFAGLLAIAVPSVIVGENAKQLTLTAALPRLVGVLCQ